MKVFALLAVVLLQVGCDREGASHQQQVSQKESPKYPEKVMGLIKLIEQLEPGTEVQDWIQLVDRTIDLPDEDVLLSGGGGLGESWQVIGIGAGDEWALSIEFSERVPGIWEAMVLRTSISKWVADEPCDTEKIYPHYYKGQIVRSEQERLALRKQ